MAGASTAAPLDAAGAGDGNPAAIGGLPRNRAYFGAELLYAGTRVSVGNTWTTVSGRRFSSRPLLRVESWLDFARVHGFENSIPGPILPTEIPPAGATVALNQSLDSWIVGMGISL